MGENGKHNNKHLRWNPAPSSSAAAGDGDDDGDNPNHDLKSGAARPFSLKEEALLLQGMDVWGNDWGKIASFISAELQLERGRGWREVCDHVRRMQNDPTPEFREALATQIKQLMDEKLRKQRSRRWNKIEGRRGFEHVLALPEGEEGTEGGDSSGDVDSPSGDVVDSASQTVLSPLLTHLPRAALEDPFVWFKDTMKSPKYGVAPMVDASELSFRMLCRNHGSDVAWTPMLHAKNFVLNRVYRQNYFSTCAQDRPLLVQFCARDAQEIALAGLMVEAVCDGVDLNLGCPQKIARKGGYGAFLMDELELVYEMVSTMRKTLSVPVTCKIRCFPNVEDTVRYAKMLVKAGAHMITVHGRTRDQRGGYRRFPADWSQIKAVVDAVGHEVPVMANGNIRHIQDIADVMEATGVRGAISAESLLEEPALFELPPEESMVAVDVDRSSRDSVDPPRKFALAREYLDLCRRFETPFGWQQSHVCRMLCNTIAFDDDFRDALWKTAKVPDLYDALDRIETWITEKKAPRVRAADRQNRVRQVEGTTVMVTEKDGTRHAENDEEPEGNPSWVNMFDE